MSSENSHYDSYKFKYLKYKTKYINLKKLYKGGVDPKLKVGPLTAKIEEKKKVREAIEARKKNTQDAKDAKDGKKAQDTKEGSWFGSLY